MKYFKILNIAVILIIILLVSCEKSKETTESYAISSVIRPVGISDQGIVQVIENVLWFYDFESEQQVILSNKPDCLEGYVADVDNRDQPCNAILPSNHGPVGMYDGNVYFFSNEYTNRTEVYKQNPTSDGRSLLATFDWKIFGDEILFIDNFAYFVGVFMIVDEEDRTFSSEDKKITILRLDLASGDIVELTDVRHDPHSYIFSITIRDHMLYYQYQYFDEGVDFDDYESQNQYIHEYVYQLNLDTLEETEIINLNQIEGQFVHIDDKRIYYVSENGNLYSTNFEGTDEELLLEAEIDPNIQIVGDGFVFSQHGNYKSLDFYHIENKELLKIDRPDIESIPYFMNDDWLVTLAELDEGNYYQVAIKKTDYFLGKDNYIILFE